MKSVEFSIQMVATANRLNRRTFNIMYRYLHYLQNNVVLQILQKFVKFVKLFIYKFCK